MEYIILLMCVGMFVLGFAAIVNSKESVNEKEYENTKCTKEDYAYHLNIKR